MKTKEEIKALKSEVESLSVKLSELSDEELAEVAGGLHDMPRKNPDEKYVMLTSRPNGFIPIILSKKTDNDKKA